jgi:hypothetical protein
VAVHQQMVSKNFHFFTLASRKVKKCWNACKIMIFHLFFFTFQKIQQKAIFGVILGSFCTFALFWLCASPKKFSAGFLMTGSGRSLILPNTNIPLGICARYYARHHELETP